MLFNFNVFGIISLIGAIFSLVFFYYSITNERNILTLTLSFLTLTIFVYILASSIEILISLYPIKLVASYFSTIIYPFVFALWLLFILIYLRPKKLVKCYYCYFYCSVFNSICWNYRFLFTVIIYFSSSVCCS